MRQKSGPVESAKQHVRDIRRATRRRYSTEDKVASRREKRKTPQNRPAPDPDLGPER